MMMNKRPNVYWQKRFAMLQERLLALGEAALPAIRQAYDAAIQNIQQEIDTFFVRFAGENGISYQEAKKILTSEERKRFQMDVKKYVRRGRQAGVSKEWRKRLENASTVYRVSRLQALQIQMRQQVELLEAAKERVLQQGVSQIYEEGYYRSIYEIQKGLGVGTPFATLDQSKIEKVVAKAWAPDGKNFSARIWGEDRTNLVHQLGTRFTQGVIRGEAPKKIAAELARTLDVSRNAAERLVLTESSFFASAAGRDSFKELGVEEYDFEATLSEKTCDLCGSLDGKTFRLSEHMPGVTASPMHPRCRCTEIPHFDDVFTDSEERFAQGKDGKSYTVPGNMGFEQWRNTYAKYTLPKVAKASDMTLQEILYYLVDGRQYLLAAGTNIGNVRIIAGQGSETEIRQVKDLVNDYGGEAWRWQKKTGIIESKYRRYEVHWYEYDGKQYGRKIVRRWGK